MKLDVAMKLTPEQRSAWRRLFESADRVRTLNPWKRIGDADVFGVSDPDSERIGFVTLCGPAGRQCKVEVLLGSRALHDYRRLRQTGRGSDRMETEADLSPVPRLEVSFGCDRPLEAWEEDLSQALGPRSWKPGLRFRSFRPGHFPWMPEDDEVRFLIRALEQLREISRRKEAQPGLLNGNGSHHFLVREPHRGAEGIGWQDRVGHFPPPEPLPIPIVWNQSDIEHLKQVPKQDHVLDADFFLFSGMVEEQGQRPLCTYVLMVVHAPSNLVLCAEPMSVVTSLERMWGAVPGVLASSLVNFDIRPRKIRVRSIPLLRLLKPLQEELDFELEQSSRLPSMEAVRESMQDFFQQHTRR